jgi:hypothetical protein
MMGKCGGQTRDGGSEEVLCAKLDDGFAFTDGTTRNDVFEMSTRGTRNWMFAER